MPRNEGEPQVNTARMPTTAYDQLVNLPDEETRFKICAGLAEKLKDLFEENGIHVEYVTFRTKPEGKIKGKVVRRLSNSPIRDIYGIRIITENQDKSKMAWLIQSQFPGTPKVFSDGTPSVRDYSKKEIREQNRKRNKNISDKYSAMHVNAIFLREGAFVYDIAEVQVMNKKQLKIYRSTREGYENGHNK